MSLVTTRQLFKERNTCQGRSFIICLTENSIIWLEHNKALMEILKQYDGKARNDTGLNYNAAQGFFGLEKYRLQKVTESPIPILLLSFLILSDIHPFIHVRSFIHSLILHLLCAQHWRQLESKQYTVPAFNLVTLYQRRKSFKTLTLPTIWKEL